MERFLTKFRVPIVVAILVLFGAAFAVESIGNHMLFRTYGLDLGIYSKTAYDFAHLRVNDGTFYHWEPFNQLGDHFDLLLALLSPLTWIIRADWLLLVVQILAVLIGALGLYRLTRDLCNRELPSMLAMLLMLCQFGVWHALGYDYHSNVVAACQLPWLIFFVRKQRLWGATAILILMAISKETVALWLCLVLVALMFDHRHDRATLRWLAIAATGCAIYFFVISMLVMPALGGGGGTGFWRYQWMGASVGEVAQWLVSHPLKALQAFFTDFTPDGDLGATKTEFFLCALASGMLLAFLKPNYLLMLLPPLAMKMFSADGGNFWGITNQYNIEICIVGCCAAVMVLSHIKPAFWQSAAYTATMLLALATALYTINRPLTHIRQAQVNILKADHYRQPDFDVATVHKALDMIPGDASVCATSPFTPHLATRDSVYIFPIGWKYKAQYYLILPDHWSYYDNNADVAAAFIADTARFQILLTDGTVFLLQAK